MRPWVHSITPFLFLCSDASTVGEVIYYRLYSICQERDEQEVDILNVRFLLVRTNITRPSRRDDLCEYMCVTLDITRMLLCQFRKYNLDIPNHRESYVTLKNAYKTQYPLAN